MVNNDKPVRPEWIYGPTIDPISYALVRMLKSLYRKLRKEVRNDHTDRYRDRA